MNLRRAMGAALAALLLAACAAPQTSRLIARPSTAVAVRSAELANTPYFPQDDYYCGPATLAMALTAIGIATTPDELATQVYLPERKGSLQIEMLAAARRHGALPVVLPPSLEALLQELAAGHAVIVLQNLGLSWVPYWHYAVAIGYDLDRELIFLRSGPEQRQELSLSTFERTWQRSQMWAFTVQRPGELPATATLEAVAAAASAFERINPPAQARANFTAALKRWPQDFVLHLGLGNAAYRAGDFSGARAAFAAATGLRPDSAAAWNNLALALLELGELDQAWTAAQRAGSLDSSFAAAVAETVTAIEAARARRQRSGGG